MPLDFEDAYDFRLTVDSVEVGLMLAVDEQTGLKQWGEGFAPMLAPQQTTSVFSSQSLPAEIDVPVTFDDFSGGAGYHHVEASLEPKQYNYSQGIDASWAGRLYLSPERRSMTTLATAPVKFYRSTLGFFALAGRYIYEWDVTDQTWTQRNDAGASVAYTDIIEMDSVLYAAMGSTGYRYSTDGITWTLFSDTSEAANYFAVRSRIASSLLFKIDSTMNVKETSNGRNGGVAWTAADEVGNSGQTVTSMLMVNDNMHVFKTDHFYRYSGTETTDLLASNYVVSTNGLKAIVGDDSAIYAPWGNRLLRYDPLGDTSYGFVFPAQATNGNPETTGSITALAGDPLNLYMAVKNGAGNTYIMKGGPNGVWHTWVYLGANDCNALVVAGPGDVHANNPVLVAGYGAAAVFFVLPRTGYDPSTDGNYTFDTSTGTIVGPWVAVNAHAFTKYLNRGAVIVESTNAARPVVLRYEVDEGAVTTLATASSNGRTEGVLTSQVPFVHIRYNLTMLTANKAVSPRTLAISLHSNPRPPRKRMWTPVVLVGDDLMLRDGTLDTQQSEAFIRNRLMLAPNNSCQMQDREGSTYIASVLDVQRVGAQRLVQGGVSKDVSLYQLRIVEIGLITDVSLGSLVWDEGAWDSGKVWG